MPTLTTRDPRLTPEVLAAKAVRVRRVSTLVNRVQGNGPRVRAVQWLILGILARDYPTPTPVSYVRQTMRHLGIPYSLTQSLRGLIDAGYVVGVLEGQDDDWTLSGDALPTERAMNALGPPPGGKESHLTAALYG